VVLKRFDPVTFFIHRRDSIFFQSEKVHHGLHEKSLLTHIQRDTAA
jgi:hypothetical protein